MIQATKAVFTYSQEIETGAEYYNLGPLEGQYKQFKFVKDNEHQLYSLLCPTGKSLPSKLSGRYTKISLLTDALDDWLKNNPSGELPDYTPPPEKRSHHKKEDNATDTSIT